MAAVLLSQAGLTTPTLVTLQEEGSTGPIPAWEKLPGVRNLARRILRASKDHLMESEGTSLGFLFVLMEEMEGARESLESIGVGWEPLQALLKNQLPEGLILESPLEFELETDASGAGRILDAAANRVREGLRVVEDYLRFHWNDPVLTESAKNFRHDFQQAILPYQAKWFLPNRNVSEDVGLEIRTEAEQTRDSIGDILKANLKRVQESLRSLEEFGKLVDRSFPEQMARFRYQSYDLEKNLMARLTRENPFKQARIYCLLNREQLEKTGLHALERLLRNGLDVVQLRMKGAGDRELLMFGNKIRELTQKTNTLLVINDRPDIARVVRADAVHLGQEDLPLSQARLIAGPEMLIGISSHNQEQAKTAVLQGANYIGIGPVFPSKTKFIPKLAGIPLVEFAAQEIRIPWFAIGGIHASNLASVKQAGASKIVVSAALFDTDDPEEELSKLLRILDSN